jgi:ABC-2 type transport system ATP-binding protein
VPAIQTRSIERRFSAEVLAVAGIDLEVAEGEIYAFLGPNGAGKTTTVRMLVTLLAPTGGSATVAGHDIVKDPSAVRRSIGVALQEAALDPLMTGRELMHLQGTLHGLPGGEIGSRSQALLDRVGLAEAADRRIGTYSGGMRRRLDLATALVHEPSVLFLDEPTTGLDPVSRLAIWEEVRKLNDEGTTVFLTTQYLEEADQLADRVGIIDDGRMAAEGTPAVLKAQVGQPHLEVVVADGTSDRAGEVLARFGDPMPSRDGMLLVGLGGGASDVAPVVRALDEAGIAVEALNLVHPTLDDVFVEKTGRHLEGAGGEDEAAGVEAAGVEAAGVEAAGEHGGAPGSAGGAAARPEVATAQPQGATGPPDG